MAESKLHSTQQKLLQLLKSNADEPLTIRELQEFLELSSTSVVAHHLMQLERKGYLKRNPYNSKNYQVLHDSPEKAVTYLNLYGQVACGPKGSILDGRPIDRIPVSSRLISFPVEDAFMVKAKGKSMEPRIFEGDFIIARKTSTPINGRVYVCVNEEEALVKRIEVIGKHIILHSYNQNFTSFAAGQDFHVEGEVKGVISRKF